MFSTVDSSHQLSRGAAMTAPDKTICGKTACSTRQTGAWWLLWKIWCMSNMYAVIIWPFLVKLWQLAFFQSFSVFKLYFRISHYKACKYWTPLELKCLIFIQFKVFNTPVKKWLKHSMCFEFIWRVTQMCTYTLLELQWLVYYSLERKLINKLDNCWIIHCFKEKCQTFGGSRFFECMNLLLVLALHCSGLNILGCWSDKVRHFKMLHWTLGNCNQPFSLFSQGI